ncbi:retinol dehydrogenase 5-like [Brevipalpus obovatus]|uniref:retinol dehydrogenase 5-like n=1 Tax=Brevipalpus obovatus TaxID=246614 RepID=UPI003D9E1F95
MFSHESESIFPVVKKGGIDKMMSLLVFIIQTFLVTLFLLSFPISIWFSSPMDQTLWFLTFVIYSIMTPFLAIKIVFWSRYFAALNTCDKISVDNKAILITDCDSDYGRESARCLNHLGFTVIAGCSQPGSEKSRRLVSEVHSPNKMHLIELDAMEDDTITEAYKTVECILAATGDQLYGLVNNAAILDLIPIESNTFEENCRNTMNSNFFGVVKIIKNFLPLLRKSRGRILTLTGAESGHSTALYAAYAASKQAVKAFMDSLRYELLPFQVQVVEIEVGLCDPPVVYHHKSINERTMKRLLRMSDKFPYLFIKHAIASEAVKKIARSFLQPEIPHFINVTPLSIRRFLRKFVGQELEFLLNA